MRTSSIPGLKSEGSSSYVLMFTVVSSRCKAHSNVLKVPTVVSCSHSMPGIMIYRIGMLTHGQDLVLSSLQPGTIVMPEMSRTIISVQAMQQRVY